MRKLCMIAIIAIFSLTLANAQGPNFGATAGYLGGAVKVKSDGETLSGNDSGFYLGLVADFGISDQFGIQSELLYANVDNLSLLQIPILAKYKAAEQFSIHAGPQITYTLEEILDDFTKLNLGLAIGAAYDFNENFFVESRYAIQLNNYYTGSGDLSSKINFLNFGIGYRFN